MFAFMPNSQARPSDIAGIILDMFSLMITLYIFYFKNRTYN